MQKPYRFKVTGSGRGGTTFETSGSMLCDFNEAFDYAMRETFRQLTEGKAVFGNPGLGCKGPYDIHRITIEQVVQ